MKLKLYKNYYFSDYIFQCNPEITINENKYPDKVMVTALTTLSNRPFKAVGYTWNYPSNDKVVVMVETNNGEFQPLTIHARDIIDDVCDIASFGQHYSTMIKQ